MEQKVFETDDVKIEVTVEENEVLDRNKAREVVFTEEYMKLIPKKLEDKKEFILNIVVKEIKKYKINNTGEIEPRIKEICNNIKNNLKILPIFLKIVGVIFILFLIYMILFKN